MLDTLLLFPYHCILAIRNSLYDSGALKSVKAPVPTICVGNIAVGGTGKTPHTDAVLDILLRSRKWGKRNIALLSRGYKRKSRGFMLVQTDGSAALCGDEPLMLKKRRPSVTVAVDRNRIDGCLKICEKKRGADIIVLDDAFQYRKLKADLSIILTDYNHPHWKDHLIPLGHLRDLPERLFDADVIVVTKCPWLEEEDKCRFVKMLGLRDYDVKKAYACTADGRKIPVLFTGIRYDKLEPVYDSTDYRYAYSKKAVVFTGIAGDGALCRFLSGKYTLSGHFKFPDHHTYRTADIRRLTAAVRKNPTACIITTEKDAQRILDYRNMPEIIKERILYAPISVNFLSETERKLFSEKITSL